MATFEPGAYAREPAGGQYVHEGSEGLREFYELLFSNDGGIPLEHCAVTDNGRACALEYNVVRWAGPSSRPRRASQFMSGARMAGWPPPASTTTPTRSLVYESNNRPLCGRDGLAGLSVEGDVILAALA